MRLAERRGVVLGALLAPAVIVLGLLLPSYWLFLATSAAIHALIAMSVGVVYSRAGMVALCPMTFVGIGAWATGWLNTRAGLPFLLEAILAACVAIPIGVVIGLPALRLRGINLAVITLAFGGAVSVVTFDRGFPGAVTQEPVQRAGFAASDTEYYFFAVLILVGVAFILKYVSDTSLGASWLAVRDSERATASLGHSVVMTKLSAFAVSAAIAGLAGALLAGQVGILSGLMFQPYASLVTFTAAVAFGAAYPEGALMAGITAAMLPEVLRLLDLPQDVAPAVFAIAALQALAGKEGGIAGQLRARWARRGTRAGHPVTWTPHGDSEANLPVIRSGSADVAHRMDKGELCLTDVSVSFGAVKALNRVSITIEPGTVHGLIGPNGAGKSTLIDAVSGFIPRHGGEILLDGKRIENLSAHVRARLGVRRSFQQGRMSPALTVGQYLSLSARHRIDASLARDLLGAFGCPPAETRVETLDAGTRRLVEVAGTLASQPAIALLDEPAAGLAAEESARLAAVIAEIPERFGCSVLLVEHDVDMVAACCDEITVLNFGYVLASGTPSHVLRNRLVRTAYLGADLEISREVD